jgi:hypothetical protein
MPLDSVEFRTSLKRLLVGLILVLVPLTVFGFYVALQGDTHIRQMNGEHFRSITRTSAEYTAEFISGMVRDVSAIANTPDLIQAVTSANRQYDRLEEGTIRTKQEAVEKKWNASAANAVAKSILTSELARMLHRDRDLNPRLLRVSVADLTGASVAATDKPLHYVPNRSHSRAMKNSPPSASYAQAVHQHA